MKTERIIGIIVTYYPPPVFVDRLEHLKRLTEELVIVDNSADLEVSQFLQKIADTYGVKLLLNERNMGIATALNQGVVYALEKNADWVLLFDQDSKPRDDFGPVMHKIVELYRKSEKGKPLGIVGCNFENASQSPPAYLAKCIAGVDYVHEDCVITSGCLCSVPMIRQIGMFKDEYFIDFVDIEYCWRALRRGYSVLRTNEVMLKHNLGNVTEKRFLWFRWLTSNHVAFRRYFMARNMVLLFWEYGRVSPYLCWKHLAYQIKDIIKAYLVEDGGGRKLRLFLYGIWHGLIRYTAMDPLRIINR